MLHLKFISNSIITFKINSILMITLVTICMGCSPSVLYYGYLPGSNYQYYEPLQHIDLKGKKIALTFEDKRTEQSFISCSKIKPDNDSELEGKLGFDYFKSYFKAMLEFNHATVDSLSKDTLKITLKNISGKLIGFGSIEAHGLIEFEVNHNNTIKNYCSDMVDGDEDSPLGQFSFATRKSAFRKMVSGATRRALESFISDLE